MPDPNHIETTCSKCHLYFTSAQKLAAHQQEKHSHSGTNCPKCGLRFPNQERFRAHWNTNHVTLSKNDKEHDPLTSNVATIILDETVEIAQSTPEKMPKNRTLFHHSLARCKACYKPFASRQYARMHYQRVHMDFSIECEVCKKRVNKNLYVRIHLKEHLARGEISANRIMELRIQNRRGQNEKPKIDIQQRVSCPECKKTFASEGILRTHRTKIHLKSVGVQPNEPKSSNANLTRGILWSCPFCASVFPSEKAMKSHRYRVHVAEKIAKPPVILPNIQTVSDLRDRPPHIEIYSNVCPVCKKAFSNKTAAKVHFRTVHRQESQIHCPYPQCLSRCSTTYNLRIHFKRAHPKTDLPEDLATKREFKPRDKKDNAPIPESVANEKFGKSISNSPLLKMFAKMKEKNAKKQSVELTIVPEVIEIEEEDKNEFVNRNFTMNFKKCSECVKSFPHREAAMLHYYNKHPEQLQTCPECNMLIKGSRMIPYHYRTKHPSIDIPVFLKSAKSGFTQELFDQFNMKHCNICNLDFETIAQSQLHFKDEHLTKFELCSICWESFRYESKLLEHWAKCHHGLKFVKFSRPQPMEVGPTMTAEEQEIVSDDRDVDNATPTGSLLEELTVSPSKTSEKSRKRFYPFIKGRVCPICNQKYASRKNTVAHYRGIHLKNAIDCSICLIPYATSDHLKEHWLLAHSDVPSTDLVDTNNKSTVDETDTKPKLDLVVSLVNLNQNDDSLSPEMRLRFMEISKEFDNANETPSEKGDKVSDSGHGSEPDVDMDTSQDEPLDLSIQPNIQSERDTVNNETVCIEYKSLADLLSSVRNDDDNECIIKEETSLV